MNGKKKVKVAIIGLGFGADFIPIYQDHPDAELYAICRRSESDLHRTLCAPIRDARRRKGVPPGFP